MSGALALGTYRCRDVSTAVSAAVAAGVEWIDTAPNYAQGVAETPLRPVLDRHPQVGISTKVGFVPAADRQAAISAGVLPGGRSERDHCLSRPYIAWQLALSHARLGRAPELVFAHNPEHGTGSRDEVLQSLASAFEEMESMADAGTIRGYGVATWTGLSSGLFTVSDLVSLAQRVGGPHHHFHAVQMPVSLVHLGPVAAALEGAGPLHQAREAGLDVFASAPLDGGALPGLMTPDLVRLIDPSATPVQAALLVVLSAPGMSRVLLSASSPAHWADAWGAVARERLSPEHLRKVIDVLGT
ncbi:aldo/keto reductase [Streptomyces sp. NTK 937]|uniref:aldo/keto reductase n=1 Tax=Streptomyces sp. NTK 937 TaxID=1487711 RepID=UPI0004A898C3|nr:aldo/keto reductase [Streptomyces sp. NTK 937]KDQ68179.1 aldo/keto reductase [Streptomyces sp. NTK 937]